MPTTRLEALSDGVFAIVITLLILEVHVPLRSSSLRRDLIGMWPLLLSYALSFFIICIWWAAHHHFFALLIHSSRGLVWLNCLFLFWLAFIPFPTALLGNYPRETLAVMCYGGAMTLAGFSFSAMRYYAFFVGKLVDPQIDPRLLKRAMLKSISNPLLHSAAVLLALVDRRIALVLYVAIPLFFVRQSRLEKTTF